MITLNKERAEEYVQISIEKFRKKKQEIESKNEIKLNKYHGHSKINRKARKSRESNFSLDQVVNTYKYLNSVIKPEDQIDDEKLYNLLRQPKTKKLDHDSGNKDSQDQVVSGILACYSFFRDLCIY